VQMSVDIGRLVFDSVFGRLDRCDALGQGQTIGVA